MAGLWRWKDLWRPASPKLLKFLLGLAFRILAYGWLFYGILDLTRWLLGKPVILRSTLLLLLGGLVFFALSWLLGFRGLGLQGDFDRERK